MISVFPSAFFLGFNDSIYPLSPAEGTTVWVMTYKSRVNICLAYMTFFSMYTLQGCMIQRGKWILGIPITYSLGTIGNENQKTSKETEVCGHVLRYNCILSKKLNNDDAALMVDLAAIMKSSETRWVNLWHSQTWQRHHSLASLNGPATECRCQGDVVCYKSPYVGLEPAIENDCTPVLQSY